MSACQPIIQKVIRRTVLYVRMKIVEYFHIFHRNFLGSTKLSHRSFTLLFRYLSTQTISHERGRPLTFNSESALEFTADVAVYSYFRPTIEPKFQKSTKLIRLAHHYFRFLYLLILFERLMRGFTSPSINYFGFPNMAWTCRICDLLFFYINFSILWAGQNFRSSTSTFRFLRSVNRTPALLESTSQHSHL